MRRPRLAPKLRLPAPRWEVLARRLLVLATGVLAALPVISSTVKAEQAGWVPAGDDGIIATRGWDVLSGHTPLVGQYSEAGLVVHGQVMHSPGPMLYWLLALPARYGSVGSLAVTMCLLNTLAIVVCVALARRRGGLVLMFAAAFGISLMCQSLPGESLHDIWNPAAALFPFLALIFIGWSLACGEYRLLPLAALVASFVLQTHLMYLAPTLVVGAVGLGGLVVWAIAPRLAARRAMGEEGKPPPGAAPPRRPRIWPWALAAVVVVCGCWTPPVINQLEASPGNFTMIARTVEHRGRTVGATTGWHALVRSVGVRPWWLYVPASEWERKLDVLHAPSTGATNSALAILAALGLVLLVAALRRRWDLFAATLIALGLCAAMVEQVANNPASKLLAETLGYTLWWGSELGLWVYLVLFWALWLALSAGLQWLLARASAGRRLRERWSGGRRAAAAVTPLALAGLAGLALVGTAVASEEHPDSHVYEYRSVTAMAKALERVLPSGEGVDYRFGALDLGTQPMEPALRFLLVRHGDRVMAPGSFPRLGSYYVLSGHPYQWVLYLTDGTRPAAHMRLASRVSFRSPWGREVLSAWVRRVHPRGHPS
ncbi:MAG TPA: hypothetical protein VMB91_08355 [Solirubrobacteraceae bacterium]|nr:hypothetical protein [Solirubrobacteraceae bacterium]